MNTLQLCKYLISVNAELIDKTAISNCHCIGLNSFIINEKPKVRLFIAEPNCELFEKFDYLNPIIPIHPHKYDDLFLQIEGKMVNHLYNACGDLEFNQYGYLRLSDKETELKLIGKSYLHYLGSKNDVIELKSTVLHTASLEGKKCSWMIIETFEDKEFEQVAYHQNLIERKELYVKMENANEFLSKYFKV